MTMLTMAGHSTMKLEVTSRTKEQNQILQEFSDQVKIIADDIKRVALSKDGLSQVIVAAVDLRAAAEQADRDAARALDLEPGLFFRPLT
jgi:uncharacterized protein YeeX (DUF496 family)